MSIYKSEKGKSEILNLYDNQLNRLGILYKDKWISTSFGQTHLVETGNFDGRKRSVVLFAYGDFEYFLYTRNCCFWGRIFGALQEGKTRE